MNNSARSSSLLKIQRGLGFDRRVLFRNAKENVARIQVFVFTTNIKHLRGHDTFMAHADFQVSKNTKMTDGCQSR